MNTYVSIPSCKKFLLAISMLCVLFMPDKAFAQAAEGCDPLVMDAMNAKAQALVARDKAVMAQLIHKPDSVLALTCFNKIAAVSATQGGAIFSGDFSAELAPIVQAGLTDQYANFREESIGGESGAVDYDAVALDSSNVGCTEIQELWDETRDGQFFGGISSGVPYATSVELQSGTPPPNAGSLYIREWEKAEEQGIFSANETAQAALERPESVPNYNALGQDVSVCDVLELAGRGC